MDNCQSVGMISEKSIHQELEMTTLKGLDSGLQGGLSEQNALLNEIDARINKIRLIHVSENKPPSSIPPDPLDFHMNSLRHLEVLYANNQRLHKIINHLSQIV